MAARNLLSFPLLVLCLVACDPGEGLLAQCEQAVARLPPADDGQSESLEGDWQEATAACKELAVARSSLASKGSALVQEIADRRSVIEKAIAARVAAKAKAAQEAAMAAEIADCTSKRWVSACEQNGVPQGGAFEADSPAKCEKRAQGFRHAAQIS